MMSAQHLCIVTSMSTKFFRIESHLIRFTVYLMYCSIVWTLFLTHSWLLLIPNFTRLCIKYVAHRHGFGSIISHTIFKSFILVSNSSSLSRPANDKQQRQKRRRRKTTTLFFGIFFIFLFFFNKFFVQTWLKSEIRLLNRMSRSDSFWRLEGGRSGAKEICPYQTLHRIS